MKRPVLLLLALLATSCGGTKPSESLVSATIRPSAKSLSEETLFVTREGGVSGDDTLTYEWRPDNSLTITHTHVDGGARQTVKGRETLRVAPNVASAAKALLSRVRPAKFEGVEQDQRPLGCERQGPHDFGEVAVAFIKDGGRPGIAGDEVGIFQLPTSESCNTVAAAEARKVVGKALALLPKSKVAASFERAS